MRLSNSRTEFVFSFVPGQGNTLRGAASAGAAIAVGAAGLYGLNEGFLGVRGDPAASRRRAFDL